MECLDDMLEDEMSVNNMLVDELSVDNMSRLDVCQCHVCDRK
jgi:hypothetical protein